MITQLFSNLGALTCIIYLALYNADLYFYNQKIVMNLFTEMSQPYKQTDGPAQEKSAQVMCIW